MKPRPRATRHRRATSHFLRRTHEPQEPAHTYPAHRGCFSLMAGLSAAQEGGENQHQGFVHDGCKWRPARHQQRHERSTGCTPRHRGGILTEDYRRPSLPRQDGLGEEKSHSPSHLQLDQGHDHRQAKVTLQRANADGRKNARIAVQDWYLIGLRIERNVAKPATFCSATFVSSFYCVPSPRGG